MDAWTQPDRPDGPGEFIYHRVEGHTLVEATRFLKEAEGACAKFAEAKHPSGGFWRDEHSQGKVPFARRPAGTKLSALLRNGDIIMTYRLSSLFSGTVDLRQTLTAWKDRRITLITIHPWMEFDQENCNVALDVCRLEEEMRNFVSVAPQEPSAEQIYRYVCLCREKRKMTWRRVVMSLNGSKLLTALGNKWTDKGLENWVSRMRKIGYKFPGDK